MITRRKAVLGISVAALASATSKSLGLTPGLLTTGADAAGPDGSTEVLENRLSRDIARVAFRADSEEGVPVLLACVNQVDRAVANTQPAKLPDWSAVVAREMQQTAAAWQSLRPNCPQSDVAHLVQILAARDLAAAKSGIRA